jgi:hypothetical protein
LWNYYRCWNLNPTSNSGTITLITLYKKLGFLYLQKRLFLQKLSSRGLLITDSQISYQPINTEWSELNTPIVNPRRKDVKKEKGK